MYCPIFVCFSFQRKLKEIFRDVHETYDNIDGRLKAEQFKVRLPTIIFFCESLVFFVRFSGKYIILCIFNRAR